MSIATDKARLDAAKADLKTFLVDNGVTVPDGAKIDGMVELLADVETGTARPTVLVKHEDNLVEIYDTGTGTWKDIPADGVSVPYETALIFRNKVALMNKVVEIHTTSQTPALEGGKIGGDLWKEIWQASLVIGEYTENYSILPADIIDYVEVLALED